MQARVKAELDKKVLSDQIRALKKHNAQLAVRSREEVKAKLKEHEERKAAQEKVRDTGLCGVWVCLFQQYPWHTHPPTRCFHNRTVHVCRCAH